jgi:rod shape-determining protein MreC
MESFFSRYKNPLVLMAVLVVQIIGLATQVKRPDPKSSNSGNGPRLIRFWAVSSITPIEKAFVGSGHFFRNTWRNYVDLHDVRKQNHDLQEEVNRLRMEQVRLREDAEQAHRLQALLGFREKFVSQTIAAQVIGSSGSEQSHVILIDKGVNAGLRPDMAVITPDGVVGKVKDVFARSAQVLLVNDRDSGAGVILQSSRLQGVLKGTNQGEVFVGDVMSDEKVEAGEPVITSGGDRIYPKGLPVGTVVVARQDRDSEPFLFIKVKPAADLNRLEEVLVITKISDESPSLTADSGHSRAADVLAERLPSVPKVEPKPGTPGASSNKTGSGAKKPETGIAAKPAESTGKPLGAVNNSAGSATKPVNSQTGVSGTTPGEQKKTAGTASASSSANPGANPSVKPGASQPGKKAADSNANGNAGAKPDSKPKKTAAKPDKKPSDATATVTTTQDSSGDKPPSTSEKPPR